MSKTHTATEALPAFRTHADRCTAWEKAWSEYVASLQRLDDLKAAGRYGYQLRMPRKSIQIRREALERISGERVRA